jgi:hypothetical protein
MEIVFGSLRKTSACPCLGTMHAAVEGQRTEENDVPRESRRQARPNVRCSDSDVKYYGRGNDYVRL